LPGIKLRLLQAQFSHSLCHFRPYAVGEEMGVTMQILLANIFTAQDTESTRGHIQITGVLTCMFEESLFN